MTTPRDDIAGLSERLRISLAGVAREESGGDNLAILLASYFEPSVEDEELDDSGTWKQGALDACDKVLDAIHAHYATQLDSLLKERDALQARVKELEDGRNFWKSERDRIKAFLSEGDWQTVKSEQAWRNRALRAEQERDEASRMNHIDTEKLEDRIEVLQLRFDNLTSLVGGIVIELGCTADSEAVFEAITKLKQERDEAYERAAQVCQDLRHCDYSSETHDWSNGTLDCAVAIRRLASGPEKDSPPAGTEG